ncbi:putative r2r3-myb transcription factor [Corchorus olitorius]|uniref:R2r3-myb transcription factor n=1 Tax=Corchorus olitorius TaxID=93759 RepID=A0A1R3KM41_9ROSI|nr:putative r2r3-myb transcription factor [Corchorus olitorius]
MAPQDHHSKTQQLNGKDNHFASSSSSSTTSLRLNQTSSSLYASSTENISRLLEGWMRSSPKTNNPTDHQILKEKWSHEFDNNNNDSIGSTSAATNSLQGRVYRPKAEHEGGNELISHEEFESILSFDQNVNNVAWEHKSTCDSTSKQDHDSGNEDLDVKVNNNVERKQNKNNDNNNPPLSFLEKWLLDESSAGQVEEMNQMLELSSIF